MVYPQTLGAPELSRGISLDLKVLQCSNLVYVRGALSETKKLTPADHLHSTAFRYISSKQSHVHDVLCEGAEGARQRVLGSSCQLWRHFRVHECPGHLHEKLAQSLYTLFHARELAVP